MGRKRSLENDTQAYTKCHAITMPNLNGSSMKKEHHCVSNKCMKAAAADVAGLCYVKHGQRKVDSLFLNCRILN